jgi:hypothetical protein
MPYRDVEEAIAIANDSDLGLAASIFGPLEEAKAVAERIEANGGIGDRDREITDYPKSREEAAEMLDEYVRKHTVARLDFEPGTVLQVTMATGHGAEVFFEKFSSPDLSEIAGMEEMFIISPVRLTPDLAIEDDVEQPDWAWPERYAPAPDAETGPGM